jgi:hypothetical protein
MRHEQKKRKMNGASDVLKLQIFNSQFSVVAVLVWLVTWSQNYEPETMSHQKFPFHENETTVVIVGASFSGLTALSHISDPSYSFRVILIDPKDYFEYSPGILVCLRDDITHSRLNRIISPLEDFYQSSAHRFVQGSVRSLSPTSKLIQVETVKGEKEIIHYDALLLCCGLPYPIPIRSHVSSLAKRKEEMISSADSLKKSNIIGILGGGLIGVELAAELCSDHRTELSKIIIFTSDESLLPTLPVSAGNRAQKWLSKNGVEIIFSAKIASLTVCLTPQKTYELLTTTGHRYSVDSVMNCTGNISLSPHNGPSETDISQKKIVDDTSELDLELPLSALRTKRGTIPVDSSFRVGSPDSLVPTLTPLLSAAYPGTTSWCKWSFCLWRSCGYLDRHFILLSSNNCEYPPSSSPLGLSVGQ